MYDKTAISEQIKSNDMSWAIWHGHEKQYFLFCFNFELSSWGKRNGGNAEQISSRESTSSRSDRRTTIYESSIIHTFYGQHLFFKSSPISKILIFFQRTDQSADPMPYTFTRTWQVHENYTRIRLFNDRDFYFLQWNKAKLCQHVQWGGGET